MINININSIIGQIPDILQYFVSGFIFMTVFLFFTSKKYENNSFLTIICVIISYCITTALKANNPNINNNQLTGWSIFFALLISILFSKFVNSKLFNKICMKVNHKSINDDIWKDIIDYKVGNILVLYSRDNRFIYTGVLLEHEEKENKSWFVLVDYTVEDTVSKTLRSTVGQKIKSCITINLNDISRIEIFYDEKSEVL